MLDYTHSTVVSKDLALDIIKRKASIATENKHFSTAVYVYWY